MARKSRQNGDQEKSQQNSIWLVALYIRLSRDDGNDESLSVTNQRKILLEYMQSFVGEYKIIDIYIDDGRSGTDYERPEFQRMLSDIEVAKVNCVICKTLSRAFRNYSDQGYFLENYFPSHNVRFISLGEPKLDSFLNPESVQGMEAPIVGLMNDRYAYATSMSIRRTFDNKRRNGEFIGAFATYGYLKNPDDKNALIIDEEVAQVVRDIFEWYTQGYSKIGIVKKLNSMGILNPTAYKKSCGFHYTNPHDKYKSSTMWSSSTISRILSNGTYIGNMIQGRQKVVSYKVHTQVNTEKADWYIVKNTHEAIIDKKLFEKVQDLLKRDTRTSPKSEQLHLFSGFLRCDDCKKSMHRQKSKQYVYFSCRTYKEQSKTACTKHSIREDKLIKAVLSAIQLQISLAVSMSEIIEKINSSTSMKKDTTRIDKALKEKNQEYSKLIHFKQSIYEDWKNGDITRVDFKNMQSNYDKRMEELQNIIQHLEEEKRKVQQGVNSDDEFLANFKKFQNLTVLTREVLTSLVDVIYIHENEKIDIYFNFRDEYKRVTEFIEHNTTI